MENVLEKNEKKLLFYKILLLIVFYKMNIIFTDGKNNYSDLIVNERYQDFGLLLDFKNICGGNEFTIPISPSVTLEELKLFIDYYYYNSKIKPEKFKIYQRVFTIYYWS